MHRANTRAPKARRLTSSLFSLCGIAVAALPAFAAGQPARAQIAAPEKEVLPWLKSPEQAALALLRDAKAALVWGNVAGAKELLERVVAFYSGTKAAEAAHAELQKMNAERFGVMPRQALGAPGSGVSRELPLAGWQTTVRPADEGIQEALIEAAGDRVFFAQGGIQLGAKAREILKRQAAWLNANPGVSVRVSGHADDDGSVEQNMRLSKLRAEAVRRRLIAEGVESRRVTVVAEGRQKPIALCSFRTCAAQNRRVITEVFSSQRADIGAPVPSEAQ